LRVLAGPDARDTFSLPSLGEGELDLTGDLRGVKIAWSPSPTGVRVEPIVVEAARSKLRPLESAGLQIQETAHVLEPPRSALDDVLSGDFILMFDLMGLGSSWWFNALRVRAWFSKEHRLSPSFSPFARRCFRTNLRSFIVAQKKITEFVEQKANRIFEDHDLMATPTLALPPFPHPGLAELGPPEVAGQPLDDRHLGWLFTWPFNLTGQPAVSIPCGWTADGLPLGLQIVGRRGADGLVLRVAAAIERLGPGDDRRPPV
jgi:aspartyl-tRNA(Asn)/glutamyl-tRNA(Gln) amidotransferase subunit A